MLNKFFYVMLAVALPLGFAACSSDDDDEDSTPYEYPVPAQKANDFCTQYEQDLV